MDGHPKKKKNLKTLKIPKTHLASHSPLHALLTLLTVT